MRLKLFILFILLALPCFISCAQVYPIQRYNGELYLFKSFKYGDHHFLYSVDFYEDGTLKSETVEFDRKISPITEQGFKFGETLISGARNFF